MISLQSVTARAGQSGPRIEGVSLSLEKGVLAILGAPADGTSVLLDVLAGRLPLRAGVARIDGKSPADARLRVAHVPLEPTLPDSLRVEELCDLAGEIRGEPKLTPASRLDPIGIGKLAERRVRSLSLGEARAVSLALALSSRAPVLLLEEPLASLDPAAPAKVIAALRARAKDAAIILTTASVRDATALSDQLGLLTKGSYASLPPSLAHIGPSGAKLRVVVAASAATEAAPFISALAEEPAITSVETAAYAASRVLHAAVAVMVGGPDLIAIARAIAEAAVRTGAKIEAIESAVLPLESIRSRLAPSRTPAPQLPRPTPPVVLGPLPPITPPPPRAAGTGSIPPPPGDPA